MLTTSTSTRRSRTAAGFSLLVLMTLTLATATLLAPGAAVAAEERDRWTERPDGPGGDPGVAWPGNGVNGAPAAENVGVTGGATATATTDVNLVPDPASRAMSSPSSPLERSSRLPAAVRPDSSPWSSMG